MSTALSSRSSGGVGDITEQIIEILTRLRDTPVPPPAEQPQGPMPKGSTVMAAVLGFRATSPDPLALTLFQAWLRPHTVDGGDGFPRLSPTVAPINYEDLRRQAFPGAAPAKITIIAGDDQSAPKGTKVPISPAVAVTDAQDRPVRSAAVTFEIEAGNGKLGGGARTELVLTDINGIATVSEWTLGPNAGANKLDANVGALKSVTFDATGTAPGTPFGTT